MVSIDLDKRNHLIVFFVILCVLYSAFSAIRPYEEDESLHVLAGQAMLEGRLDPFKVEYNQHYSNPFHYIIGSPLAALMYGTGYKIGGLFLVRALAGLCVLLSILIVYVLIRKFRGNTTLPLLLLGFSGTTIMLASVGLLDSLALLFLMLSLYLIVREKMFLAGILSALAMTSKFVLVIPFLVIFAYQVRKRGWVKYGLGIFSVIIPFLILYRELIPVLLNFVLVTKLNGHSVSSLKTFLELSLLALPILSVAAILFIKSRKFTGIRMFFILPISIIIFQAILLDYNSLYRHLPYAEFSSAVLVGVLLAGRKVRLGLIALLIVITVGLAIRDVNNYPSYTSIRDNLSSVNGKVLALNVNSFMLAKGLPVNSTADQVFSYYYFSYDGLIGSDVQDYEKALKDGFFDYALISSHPAGRFPRYEQVESLVRKYYCQLTHSAYPNGIDIYQRCK